MVNKEILYRTFGELLYIIAKSDGVIQEQEVHVLEEILKGHPRAEEIKWSFDYETAHQSDVETLYKKVIEIFSDHGPDEEYDYMIYALKKVAEASNGMEKKENNVIQSFSHDLLERFQKDIDRLYNSNS